MEVRNNLAKASQIQFEVLRRALWAQQARPNVVFDWKFGEKAVQDPKMTSCLTQGAKAKICEAVPYVNSMGSQYAAAPARVELGWDALRHSRMLQVAQYGIHERVIKDILEDKIRAVKELLQDREDTPTSLSLISCAGHRCQRSYSQDTQMHDKVLLSARGCHVWMDAKKVSSEFISSVQPDLMVESYLDAKYYHYSSKELEPLLTILTASEALAQEDAVPTLTRRVPRKPVQVCASIDDNFNELENACPKPNSNDSHAINPKWIDHHQDSRGSLGQR